MERLTKRNINYNASFFALDEIYQDLSIISLDKVGLMLAAYEDAEEQGRIVVLPCNGVVFIHSGNQIQEMEIVHYSGNNLGVYTMRCECKEQYEDCDTICKNEHEKACAYQFRVAEINKTVFLTREAAEAALNK